MNKDNPFKEMLKFWIRAKMVAIKSDDWLFYQEIMSESKKVLSGCYANGTEKWYLGILAEMIKLASSELKKVKHLTNHRKHNII